MTESSVEQRDLRSRQIRSVYLITYSQADESVASSREEFARKVVHAFVECYGGVSGVVETWVCSQENHATAGHHFHMAVKLKRPRRWLAVRKRLGSVVKR